MSEVKTEVKTEVRKEVRNGREVEENKKRGKQHGKAVLWNQHFKFKTTKLFFIYLCEIERGGVVR